MRHAISEKSDAEPTSIQIVACNMIQLATAESIELVRREIEAQRILDGCRGCRRPGDDIGFDPTRLVVHLYDQGLPVDEGAINLRTLIADPTKAKALRKDNVFQIMASMVLALQDCHANGVVHGDIKPENSTFISRRPSSSEDSTKTFAFV
jgi:serine/threonine protein kinase